MSSLVSSSSRGCSHLKSWWIHFWGLLFTLEVGPGWQEACASLHGLLTVWCLPSPITRDLGAKGEAKCVVLASEGTLRHFSHTLLIQPSSDLTQRKPHEGVKTKRSRWLETGYDPTVPPQTSGRGRPGGWGTRGAGQGLAGGRGRIGAGSLATGPLPQAQSPSADTTPPGRAPQC